MASTFYIVKMLLALDNIFHGTESILAQSHDGAKKIHIGASNEFLAVPHSGDV